MIGGKVLDPSAVAAYLQGSIAMESWVETAKASGLTLYLPLGAFSEARAVYPDRLDDLGLLVQESQVMLRELGPEEVPKVLRLLAEAGCFDATAGHVILVARARGWPVLTTDPGRLTRIAPDLDLDLL